MNLLPREALFDLNRFFDGFSQPTAYSAVKNGRKAEAVFSPRVDIAEHPEHYQLVAELPGISKDNINVTVEESVLTIEASNQAPDAEEGVKALRRERRYGKYARSFNLGQDIEQESINAAFKDGLLILTIPKQKEAANKTRQIEIH